jgi:hypothetical protein
MNYFLAFFVNYIVILLKNRYNIMMSNKKEKMTRQVIIMVQPSLYNKFSASCEENYKKISDVLRELMCDYVKSQERRNEKAYTKTTLL